MGIGAMTVVMLGGYRSPRSFSPRRSSRPTGSRSCRSSSWRWWWPTSPRPTSRRRRRRRHPRTPAAATAPHPSADRPAPPCRLSTVDLWCLSHRVSHGPLHGRGEADEEREDASHGDHDVSLLVAISLVGMACSSGGDSGQSSNDASAAPSGSVSLFGFEDAVLPSIVAEFEKAYPNVHVTPPRCPATTRPSRSCRPGSRPTSCTSAPATRRGW